MKNTPKKDKSYDVSSYEIILYKRLRKQYSDDRISSLLRGTELLTGIFKYKT